MKSGPDPAFPTLVIDTASQQTVIGLGVAETDWTWCENGRESGISLFEGVAGLLKSTETPLGRLVTVVFCEGPGSLLGIRTAAMALRTWVAGGFLPEATLMTYSSLDLAGIEILRTSPQASFTAALDARRQSWFCLTHPEQSSGRPSIRRIPAAASDGITGPVFLPEGFPIWNPRPESWKTCRYDPRLLESPGVRQRILRPVDRPDAFQLESPTYQKWTPAISRVRPGANRPEEVRP